MDDSTQPSDVPSKKKRFTWLGAVCVLIALAVGGYYWLSQKQPHTPGGPPEVFMLAVETSLLPATVWVAENQGYFRDEGMEVFVRNFDSGRNALETMLVDNSIDLATVAQSPVVFNSFRHENFVVIAAIAHSRGTVKVLARKDSGIQRPFDLLGKRIGVTLRSTGHYFLESFLDHYGFSLNDVDLAGVDANMLGIELLEGRLDAITTWEPYIYRTQMALGEENAVLMTRPTLFRKDLYLAARRDYSEPNKENLKKFLRAVIRAEDFIEKHPEESQLIVAKRLGVEKEIVESVWNTFSFKISLRQASLHNLKAMERWAVEHGYINGNTLTYADFIDQRILQEVDSARVTVTLSREARR